MVEVRGGTERERRRCAFDVEFGGGEGLGGGKTTACGMGPPSMCTSLTIFLRRAACSAPGAAGAGAERRMLSELRSTFASRESVDGDELCEYGLLYGPAEGAAGCVRVSTSRRRVAAWRELRDSGERASLATGGKGGPGSKSGTNFSSSEGREELEERGVKMTPSRLVERWLVREDRSAKGGTKISSEASDVCGDGSSSTGVVPIIAPSFLAECRTRARSWLRRRLVVGGFLVARLIGQEDKRGLPTLPCRLA